MKELIKDIKKAKGILKNVEIEAKRYKAGKEGKKGKNRSKLIIAAA